MKSHAAIRYLRFWFPIGLSLENTCNKKCVEECQNEENLSANDLPCNCRSPRTLVELGGNVKICTENPVEKCAEHLKKYVDGRCVACDPSKKFSTQASKCSTMIKI
ncbi:MAG: hypothetical protein MHMPM18_000862 [Marteilia pararefringens]